MKKAIITIIIITIALFSWMHLIEPKIITVNDYILENQKIPTSFDGFTIIQFSDIHFGRTTNEKEIKKIVQKINECNPDLVLFSGDLFDPYITIQEENINFLKEELKTIKANIKKIAILGDYDLEKKDTFTQIMNDANFEILNGQNQKIYYKGTKPIYLNGTSANETIKNENLETDSLQLYLSHDPIIINEVKNKVDYYFCGHTLGGLIRIPFTKGLLNKHKEYDIGKNEVDNTTMFISNGLGTQDISLRFLNLPSINCYRFSTK